MFIYKIYFFQFKLTKLFEKNYFSQQIVFHLFLPLKNHLLIKKSHSLKKSTK